MVCLESAYSVDGGRDGHGDEPGGGGSFRQLQQYSDGAGARGLRSGEFISI